jgi:hypothetical protein
MYLMNNTVTQSPTASVFIAWCHFASTPAAWQNFFRGEDADPYPAL